MTPPPLPVPVEPTGTKRRIVDATLDVLRREGIAGTSARAIAAAGGFGTALIFYHFGSLEGALVAAAQADTAERTARYGERMAEVTDLRGLVEVARELHRENVASGSVAALVQVLAAVTAHPALAEPLATAFDPWIALIRTTLERVAPDALEGILEPDDAALAITSLFLGLELVTSLGDRFGRAERLLDGLDEVADLVGAWGALSRAFAPGPEGGAAGA